MSNRTVALISAGVLAVAASALTVDNTAGQLWSLVPDTDISELTVTGTLNDADLRFVATSLTSLQSLDMSGAAIDGNVLPVAALMGTALRDVALPQSLETIGYAAFAGCARLESVTLPPALTVIGGRAFSATGLTSVTVPATVTTLGQGAFALCPSLATAELHCAAIGDEAFKGTPLGALTIGSEVQTIGAEAFAATSLAAVDLSQATSLTSIGDYAFASSALTSATLPEGVTLGTGAFLAATALAEVTAPVSDIPAYAFAASGLASGTAVAEGVTAIGDRAFYAVTAPIAVFNLPSTLNQVGTEAFAGTTGIAQYEIAAEAVPALGENVWQGVDQAAVPLGTTGNEVAALYKAAEQWQDFHVLWEYLLGDVNDDGYVDVSDIAATASDIMGHTPSPFVVEAADVNNDTHIDVSDLSGIANFVVKEIRSTVRKVRARTPAVVTGDVLAIDRVEGVPSTLTLRLDNSIEYVALQCDITLPSGMTIAESGISAAGRSVAFSTGDDGVTRLAVYSATNRPMPVGGGVIATIDVITDGTLDADAAVEVGNVLMADAATRRYQGVGGETRLGAVTAVNDVSAGNWRVAGGDNLIVIDAAAEAVAQVVSINGISRAVEVAPGRNVIDSVPAGIYVVSVAGVSHKVVVR